MISAIVLAAGESKRMGQVKLLLPWQGKTILERVLDALLNSQVDEVILVLGHEAERIREKVPTQKIKVVINPDYKKGMSTSIRRGLLALDEKAQGFMVVLGDQPKIGKETLNRLISEFQRVYPEKNIVLPAYHGFRGHPVLFSVKYLEEALRLEGDVGCRQILADHPEDILTVPVNTDAVLFDIDTPEDYRENLKRKSSGEPA
ncbi:MAG: molybdenum cofactor cytidylyltransferase [Deltaproteobacteria bacterium]|nr:molybdenum cofactor cytidylyltransferase [Deltaproteobacteria bacterium]